MCFVFSNEVSQMKFSMECHYNIGWNEKEETGPEVIKLFSCSTQMNIKFFLLINVKMSKTIVGILTFMSGKKSILGLSEPKKKTKKKTNFLIFFILMSI